jgi:DNA invertase Pin-like site-specific DNA recombinase
MTDILIGDADGVYHPGLFNDRLVLGLKGTMSEAELHILRARLDGGSAIRAHEGSYAEDCRWALSGVRRMAKCAFTPMRL